MTNRIRMPGYAADASLAPPSRAYRSTSSHGHAGFGPVVDAFGPKGQEPCDPFCVCQKGITPEGCPCCENDGSGMLFERRGRKT